MLSEYHALLTDPQIIQRYPELKKEKVELALRRLSYVGERFSRMSVTFEFPREPRDEKFLELAIAGHATHLVKTDNDLLSISTGHSDAARRFRPRSPSTQISKPAAFLDQLDA